MEVEMKSTAFVRWDEVFVSTDKGRKEVRYYLKRKDGTSDLAVVGKENSLRHMSYHYTIRVRDFLSISANSVMLKLKSRRDVIDSLNSIISVTYPHPPTETGSSSLEVNSDRQMKFENFKDLQLRKLGKHTTDFSWIGSATVCRKRRKHYQSYQRNGVKISVHDFVYVLAEEDKRLVAYLDDMYEDSRGNRMVVVQWFHKIDEVGIALPQSYNDREIFFSLCLQDLSTECIDGLTSVLSPQHYEKFLREATHTKLDAFVCHRQFDNDNLKPFDITQVKGYGEQEILKYMFTTLRSSDFMTDHPASDDLNLKVDYSDTVGVGIGVRPKKRLHQLNVSSACLQPPNKPKVPDTMDSIISNVGYEMHLLKEHGPAVPLAMEEDAVMKNPHSLTIGAQVEVLSQDSGIRGCWFRALVVKKHKDKVKVRYQDIKDAADETNNLEEWILTTRIALPDKWHLRVYGRTTVRPALPFSEGNAASIVKDGSVVDAWWHDCWWEGIVIRKESEDNIHVYFPGEKRDSFFANRDLRPSQEWLGSGWKQIKGRPEIANSILADLETKPLIVKSCDKKSSPGQSANSDDNELSGVVHKDTLLISNNISNTRVVHDLAKDDLLSDLKWKSTKKRRHSRGSSRKLSHSDCKKKSSMKSLGTRTWEKFFIPSSLKVDHDNCKYTRDSAFSSSVVSPLTNLVLSR